MDSGQDQLLEWVRVLYWPRWQTPWPKIERQSLPLQKGFHRRWLLLFDVYDVSVLKRLGRDMTMYPSCSHFHRWRDPLRSVDGESDSDWRGDRVSRK